ncbi:unnamed protein product [Ixodes hexagonus]
MTMQRRWISEGVAEDPDAEGRAEVLSRLPRHLLRRQTSDNIATENESQENINLSWNAPEFYKRLKRLQRRPVECEYTWNPNRWASCPEVVDPSSLSQDVRFYVGTSPSGRSINEDEEQYKTYLYYLLNTTRSASSELRFLELFQEAQDNIRAFQRQDSNCTLDIKPVRTAQSGTSWSSGVNDVYRRDKGFDSYHQDDVVPSGKKSVDDVEARSRKSWSSSVGDAYSRDKVLSTYQQGEGVTCGGTQVAEVGSCYRKSSSASVDNVILPKKLSSQKCNLQREASSRSTGTLQVGVELCSGLSSADDVPAVIPSICLQLESEQKVVGCVPSACEAYDNPCYETGGSPRCSFIDDGPSQCRVGQPVNDGLSAENSQCDFFSASRVKELFRYVFCCECRRWNGGKVQRRSGDPS